jgi:hypothetical protein
MNSREVLAHPEVTGLDALQLYLHRMVLLGTTALQEYHAIAGKRALYHGSPLPAIQMQEYLMPKQPMWRDSEGKLHPVREPYVFVSNEPDYPKIKSFLHYASPALQRLPLADLIPCAGRKDSRGNVHQFTSLQVLEELRGYDAKGYLHVPGNYAYDFVHEDTSDKKPFLDGLLIDWPVDIAFSFELQLADLPDDLNVVSAPRRAVIPMLDALVYAACIEEVSSVYNIEVTKFGDLREELFS